MNQPIIVTSKKSRYGVLSILSLFMTLISGLCIFAYSSELHIPILSLMFILVGVMGVAFQKYSSKANLKMGFPLVNIVLTTSSQTPQQVYYAILHQYGDKFIQ